MKPLRNRVLAAWLAAACLAAAEAPAPGSDAAASHAAELCLAYIAAAVPDYARARASLLEAEAQATKAGTPFTGAAQAMLDQAWGFYCHTTGNYLAAVARYEKALSFWGRRPDVGHLLKSLALARWRSEGPVPAVGTLLEEAMGCLPASDLSDALNDKAAWHLSLAQPTEALACLAKADPAHHRTLLHTAAAHRQTAHKARLGTVERTLALAQASTALDQADKAPGAANAPGFFHQQLAACRWSVDVMSRAGPADEGAAAASLLNLTLQQIRQFPPGAPETAALAFFQTLDAATPFMGAAPERQQETFSDVLQTFGLALDLALRPHAAPGPLLAPLRPEDWTKALPPDSALAVWFVCRRPLGDRWRTGLAALVVGPGGMACEWLEQDLAGFEANFPRTVGGGKATARGKAARSIWNSQRAAALSKALWHPVQRLLARTAAPGRTATTLYVWLDGPLASLPLAFLAGPDGQTVLQTGPQLVHLATPACLLRPAPVWSVAYTGPVLATDASSVHGTIRPVPGEPTPSTAAKPLASLNHVASELDRCRTASRSRWHIVPPGEAALREALGQKDMRVFYFAGHGHAGPARTDPYAASPEWEPGQTGAPRAAAHTCLLLPGCAVSGQPASEDDGFFFPADAEGLGLSHLSLAVLSTCYAGHGLSRAGEIQFDFARSLHRAGVPDVFASCTSVDDAEASHLLPSFFRALAADHAPAEAAWLALRERFAALRREQDPSSVAALLSGFRLSTTRPIRR